VSGNLNMRIETNQITNRQCWMCLSVKPIVDFYSAPKYLCKSCCAIRTKEWAKNNPKKRREITERYRKTAKGSAAYYRRHKRWREKNKWCDAERAAREITNLTDFYIRTILKRRGIKTPTQEQIAAKRRFVQTLRARRNIALINYGFNR
jgi:hypothetical protein